MRQSRADAKLSSGEQGSLEQRTIHFSSALLGLVLIMFAFLYASPSARADIKPELPTMGANARAFYLTSKSGLAESNDTGFMTAYSLNVYAGSGKTVSVHLEGKNAAVNYALNNAKMTQSELSFVLKVYLGFFYLGAYGGSMQNAIVRSDSTQLDVFANHYGGTMGMLANITKGSYLGAEVRGGVPADLKEATQQAVQMGLKLEGELFMNFDVTKNILDLQAGFYYSSQAATFASSGNGETISAPFIGFSLNTDF